MHVTVAEDLRLAIGKQSERLSPGEAFQLAEKLIRRATVRMIAEEAGVDRSEFSTATRTRSCGTR